MDRKLKLAFIGGGINSAIGDTHFIASQMDKLFSVEAGCFSRDEAINEATAKKWGIAPSNLYSNWQDLINNAKSTIDAIVVLTPTPAHLDPVLYAIENDIPVICEKALASTSLDAQKMMAALEENAGYLAVTYNYTGYPMVRELKEMIRHGRLGRIEQIHIEMPQEGFARLNREGKPMVPQQWRMRDGDIPTISLDLGVHLHHMIDFLTGEKPVSLVATQSSMGQFRQVVDNTMALVKYTNGLECNLWFSKSALGHRNGLRVRIYGDKGSAEWFQLEPELIHYCDNDGQKKQIDRACNDVFIAHQQRYNRFKSGHPSGFLEAFANLYVDVFEDLTNKLIGKPAQNDFVFHAQDAYEGLLMLEAIELSTREQRWVDL